MKKQFATYSLPAIGGGRVAGHLNYRHARKLTPEIVRARVAKVYRVKPDDVQDITVNPQA